MPRARVLAAISLAFVPSILALSWPAEADPAGASAAAAKHDPDNVTAISETMNAIALGTERFVAKDVNGAIGHFRRAAILSPRDPLPRYMLAQAHLAAGRVTDAEAALRDARDLPETKRPSVRARVLFAYADVLERQKKWAEAKEAWRAYAEHAAKQEDAGVFPGSSAARLDAIDKILDAEKGWAAVRDRAAAEKSASPKR
jgi:Flp pilus assembly protein TadD